MIKIIYICEFRVLFGSWFADSACLINSTSFWLMNNIGLFVQSKYCRFWFFSLETAIKFIDIFDWLFLLVIFDFFAESIEKLRSLCKLFMVLVSSRELSFSILDILFSSIGSNKKSSKNISKSIKILIYLYIPPYLQYRNHGGQK